MSLPQAAAAGYCYGDPTAGQRVIYKNGLSGVPIVNVNNNCSTGSTALWTARNLVMAGYDCALAVGFEKMEKGTFHRAFQQIPDHELSRVTCVLGRTHLRSRNGFGDVFFFLYVRAQAT